MSRWEGLARFTGDGRIELDSHTVERATRPLALNRKNSLFAGSDGGGEHWAVLASLVETCKLNNLKPQAYLADVLTRLVNGHPNSRIDDPAALGARGLRTPLREEPTSAYKQNRGRKESTAPDGSADAPCLVSHDKAKGLRAPP